MELAEAYNKNGQFQETIKLLRRVLYSEAPLIPEDHPLRVDVQVYLGSAYKGSGMISELIPLYEEILVTIHSRSPKIRKIQTGIQVDLAIAYSKNGRTEAATPMLEQIISADEPATQLDRSAQIEARCVLG